MLRWRAAPAALRGPRLHCSASPLPSRTAGHRGPVAAQRSTSRAASRSAPRSLPLARASSAVVRPARVSRPPPLCAPAPSRRRSARAFELRVAASWLATLGACVSATARWLAAPPLRRVAPPPPCVCSPAAAPLGLAAAARLFAPRGCRPDAEGEGVGGGGDRGLGWAGEEAWGDKMAGQLGC